MVTKKRPPFELLESFLGRARPGRRIRRPGPPPGMNEQIAPVFRQAGERSAGQDQARGLRRLRSRPARGVFEDGAGRSAQGRRLRRPFRAARHAWPQAACPRPPGGELANSPAQPCRAARPPVDHRQHAEARRCSWHRPAVADVIAGNRHVGIPALVQKRRQVALPAATNWLARRVPAENKHLPLQHFVDLEQIGGTRTPGPIGLEPLLVVGSQLESRFPRPLGFGELLVPGSAWPAGLHRPRQTCGTRSWAAGLPGKGRATADQGRGPVTATVKGRDHRRTTL